MRPSCASVSSESADERELPSACLCVDRNSHATYTHLGTAFTIDHSLGQNANFERLKSARLVCECADQPDLWRASSPVCLVRRKLGGFAPFRRLTQALISL